MPAVSAPHTGRRRLDRAFFARDAETVARALLGTTLAVAADGEVRRVRLVETEAYVGPHDLACHAARGRTARTQVMFGPPGFAYVYLIYGLHHLLNVVTGPAGDPQAVLLRAAEPLGPVCGDAGRTGAPADSMACCGPGRLTRFLGVARADDGIDLCPAPEGAVGDGALGGARPARAWFEAGAPPGRLGISARIGVDYAGAWAAAPLRFFDVDSAAVSPCRSRR